jgi:hypothetical protein
MKGRIQQLLTKQKTLTGAEKSRDRLLEIARTEGLDFLPLERFTSEVNKKMWDEVAVLLEGMGWELTDTGFEVGDR